MTQQITEVELLTKLSALEGQLTKLTHCVENSISMVSSATDRILILHGELKNSLAELNKRVTRLERQGDTKPLSTEELVDKLYIYFDSEELEELLFKAEINSGDIAGDTHRARVRNLVDYFTRRNTLPILLRLAKQERPNVLWE